MCMEYAYLAPTQTSLLFFSRHYIDDEDDEEDVEEGMHYTLMLMSTHITSITHTNTGTCPLYNYTHCSITPSAAHIHYKGLSVHMHHV